jgi:hypothetical protein
MAKQISATKNEMIYNSSHYTMSIDWGNGNFPIESFILYGKKELVFPKPTHVIQSNDMTHVFWSDGTKTSVKWDGKDIPDVEHAVAVAIAHKMFGSKNKFKKFVAEKTRVQESKPTMKQISKKFVNNTVNNTWEQKDVE